MCEQQYQAEVLDELKQQDYNTNLGTYHFLGVNSCESTFVHSFGNSGTDGKVRTMGTEALHYRKA